LPDPGAPEKTMVRRARRHALRQKAKNKVWSGLVVELSLTGVHNKAPADAAVAPGTLVDIGVHELHPIEGDGRIDGT
jgi:hypothetical protein